MLRLTLKIVWRILLILIAVAILFVISVFAVDYYVESIGKNMLTTVENAPDADAIIVLGAYVDPNGVVSEMLRDRLEVGYQLYKNGKSKKIIVSGDHGQKSYDEVNAMREYLQNKGVPRDDIFMDHAGFDTYDSMYRARDVFLVRNIIIVSQEYHAVRGAFIADRLGMNASCVGADTRIYEGMRWYRIREYGSRYKAFLQAQIFKTKPKFLGDVIPVWGDGSNTDDGK